MSNTALTKLNAACRSLSQIVNIPEAKEIRDKAHALAYYMKHQKGGIDAGIDASEIAVRAERRIGELLAVKGERRGAVVKSQRATLTERGTAKSLPLDISKSQSHRWRKVASVPAKDFERELSKAREQRKAITTTLIARLAKEQQRETKRADDRKQVEAAEKPAELTGVYSTIVIDPPWDWGDEGDKDQLGRAKPDYATMTIDEIAKLPVGQRAAKDAHLYLWITNRSLPKGFSLLDAWGFRYVTCLTWCKPSFGMGNYFRGSTEQVLFAVRGSLPLLRKNVGTWFEAPRPNKKHSGKPVEFFELVESCSPGPRLEMFSRSLRDGWVHWGSSNA